MRYIKGSKELATFMPKAGKSDTIEAFLDGDWACDDLDRKSASGGYLMVGGCRLHSHSRTTGQHALSSGESEIMSMSEILKEAKLMQYNLEFCGMVLLPIVRCCKSILSQERRRWNETSGCEVLLAAGGTGERKLQSEAC